MNYTRCLVLYWDYDKAFNVAIWLLVKMYFIKYAPKVYQQIDEQSTIKLKEERNYLIFVKI